MSNIRIKGYDFNGITSLTVPKQDSGTATYTEGGGGAPNLQTKSVSYTATTSTQTAEVTASSGYDGLDKVNVTVNAIPAADADGTIRTSGFVTENGVRKWKVTVAVYAETPGWLPEGLSGGSSVTAWDALAAGTIVTPSESQQTVGTGNTMMEGPITISAISSNYVGSGVTRRTDGDISGVFDDGVYSVNVPPGYYQYAHHMTVPTGTEGTPTVTTSTVSNHSVTVTPVVVNTAGYIEGGTQTGTPVVITVAELVSGNLAITSNTSSLDVSGYATVSVNVPGGGGGNMQSKSNIDPTESSQTISPDTGYDGLSSVQINAIGSDYVGSGVPRRNSLQPGADYSITAQSGYYSADVTVTIPNAPHAAPAISVNAANGLITATHTQTTDTVVTGSTVTTSTSQLSVLGAMTYHPNANDQEIYNGYYLTGNQTIKGVKVTNLSAGNIKKDVVIKIGDADDDDCVTIVTGTYTGAGIGTLLATSTLGTVNTSSTSAVNLSKSVTIAGVNSYDALVVETSVNQVTNGRHSCTVAVIWLTASSDVATKNGATIASNKLNMKISSGGVTTTRQSTTAYGVFPNSCTISNGSATLAMYARYNSTQTGTINGIYTTRVYGLKLYDLIGG